MNLFWQISVVMLDQIVFLAIHRLGYTSTTVSLSATTSLSITHDVVSRFQGG